jgi:hypothetical protein
VAAGSFSGVILAAFSAAIGLVEAYATRTTLYSALMGFSQAALVLAVTFGLNLDDVKQGALLSTIAVVAGLFLRNTTDSSETAISSASPGALKSDLELLALQGPQEVTLNVSQNDPVPVEVVRT